MVIDNTECAKQYLIKVMKKKQKKNSPLKRKLSFTTLGKEAPDLVKNLNLFLDKGGIICSDGKIVNIWVKDVGGISKMYVLIFFLFYLFEYVNCTH